MTLNNVALTPSTRNFDNKWLSDIVLCLENGDFGDLPDDEIMPTLSASMDGRPHHGIFPPLVALARPDHESIMLISFGELRDNDFRGVVETFGFNPDTLQPV
jgi:hypothetical protein